jgi:hypothetical protein
VTLIDVNTGSGGGRTRRPTRRRPAALRQMAVGSRVKNMASGGWATPSSGSRRALHGSGSLVHERRLVALLHGPSVVNGAQQRGGEQRQPRWRCGKYLPQQCAIEGIRPRHVGLCDTDGMVVDCTVPTVKFSL